MPLTIGVLVVLEDDYFDMDLTRELLRKHFPGFQILPLRTEAQFHEAFPALIAAPPSIVLLGARVKWTDPAPKMPEPPAEVLAGTYREAGFRCWKMLRGNPQTKSVPVIFYTSINERGNAPAEAKADRRTTFVVRRIEDEEIVGAVREAISAVV
jgi:CheY-like chemotaxis protein